MQEKLSSNGYDNIIFEITFDEDYAYTIRKVVVKNSDLTEDEWKKIRSIITEYVGRATVEKEDT